MATTERDILITMMFGLYSHLEQTLQELSGRCEDPLHQYQLAMVKEEQAFWRAAYGLD